MNGNKFEKILNPVTFVFLNGAIILTAELTGELFFDRGIIHIIALFFVALSIARIFIHYYTYDPILEKFFHACSAALCVFAISHIVEYFNMGISHYYTDSVLVNTLNFYLISLVLIGIGAEVFLRIHDNRKKILVRFLISLVIFFVVLVFIFAFNKNLVSLDLDNFIPYTYACLITIFSIFTIKKISRIGNHVKFSNEFTRYLITAIILIGLATLPYIFYDLLSVSFGIPIFQLIYLSHFFFYVALSLVFLAFGKVVVSGGLYEDVKKATL